MDLMTRRRALMARVESGEIDTTVQIAEYGYAWDRGRYAKYDKPDYGLSAYYHYQVSSSAQTLVSFGLDPGSMCMLQRDGSYVDWWGQSSARSDWQTTEGEREVLNAGSNEISCSIYIPIIDTTYAYIKETGQILFAGRNSIYYGHRNINELN